MEATSRDLVVKTLNHKAVDRAPRDLWFLESMNMFRQDELNEMLRRYPLDFFRPQVPYPRSEKERGIPGRVGKYTDAWGCTWHVAQPGVIGEVKVPPLADWSKLDNYKPPFEILEKTDFSAVNPVCAESSLFTLVGSSVRPFERMQFIRGSEALFLDLAYGSREVQILLEMLHDYFVKELRLLAETDVDGVSFMDDWGSQISLLISPDLWRDMFKPLYIDYCDILHEKGKYVFFHTDGNVSLIFEDLVEIGIDAINSQLFCMDIEKLGEKFSGKVTFWGEIDRQHILPYGTVEEVREAVRRVRSSFDRGNGGVIAQCEWGIDVPFDNIVAVCDEWLKPM